MTVAVFINDTLTLRKIGVTFSVDLGELAAKKLRDQLLARYPVEPEATPMAGPLHEVALAEARPGDIATFEIKDAPEEGKFVCTLKKLGDDTTLYADRWLTANKRPIWCIRNTAGDDAGCMKDLHIWRWDGVDETAEEAVELPDEPTVRGGISRPPATRCCTTTVTSIRIGADRLVRSGVPTTPMRNGMSSCATSGLNDSR